MSTPNDVPDLLRRGIDAAREGKRTQARDLFEQVVELDEKNEKGWFWLASVVDTDEERRICLSNVLHINPNNERAKRAMDALQTKAKEEKNAAAEEEVVAGITRRQMTLIVGLGGAAVIVILLITLVVVIGNNNRQNDERATALAVAQVATDNAATVAAAAEQATGTAVADAATQQALITPELPTRALPTLPPTWTPTPQATLPPTRAALPPPTGLTGKLAVWGGIDLLNNGYLPLGYYNFDAGNQYQALGDESGRRPSFDLNGQRLTYQAYDPFSVSSTIQAMNLNGTQKENLPDRWVGQTILAPQQPRLGGQFEGLMAFVAVTQTRQTPQVFVLNLNAVAGENPVKQLSDDDFIYSDPALSPDGSKIAVVRSDPNSATPTIDIISVDVNSGGKFAITNDGASYMESSPMWTSDGQQIVYAAVPSNQPDNSDIFIKNANGTGSSQPLYTDPANDIYPVLSPDGQYLAFASSSGGGSYDIFVFDRSSKTLFQLTNSPEDDYPGDWWQP